jgi:hypothetical protein
MGRPVADTTRAVWDFLDAHGDQPFSVAQQELGEGFSRPKYDMAKLAWKKLKRRKKNRRTVVQVRRTVATATPTFEEALQFMEANGGISRVKLLVSAFDNLAAKISKAS